MIPHEHRLVEATLREGLTTHRVGGRILVLSETGSTNDVALAHASDERFDGFAVFAEFQTAGRGRLGRSWISPRGASLLCSVLVFVDDSPAWLGRSTLIGGVAAYDAAAPWCTNRPAIKWPNDLLVDGRKLGGVLVESRPTGPKRRALAIGIGINCLQQPGHWPAELRDHVTSLDIECNRPVQRVEVARSLLLKLDAWLSGATPFDDQRLRQAWNARANTPGQRLRLRSEGREFAGSVVEIDPVAGLLVELDGGGRRHFDPARTTVL